MTYCCGILVKDGLVMIADTRTNAGLDNISTFRKLHIFNQPGDRIMAVASAGNLAISQSVLSTLSEGLENPTTGELETLLNAPTMFQAAQQSGMEGIVAKHRNSCYEERRSGEWQKIKVTQTVDCVIGGFTDPEGSRQYFGSMVLGLYDKKGQLIHVGQAGTGFNHAMLKLIYCLRRKPDMSAAREGF